MSTIRTLIALSALIGMVSCNRKDAATAEKAPAAPAEAAAKPAPEPVAMEKFFESALEGDMATVKQALAQPGAATFAGPDGRTALMLASFNGHTEVAELLLNAGAPIDSVDKIKRTALMYASSGPNAVTVAMLVKRGANVNLTDGEQNWTPLMFACAEGNTEVARILLGAGANPNAIDSDGDTSLKFAQSKGFKEIAEMITAAQARAAK